MTRIVSVREPRGGCRGPVRLAATWVAARRVLIDTPGYRRSSLWWSRSTWEERAGEPSQGARWNASRGERAEPPVVDGLKTCRRDREPCGEHSPEAAAFATGPPLRRCSRGGQTAGGPRRSETAGVLRGAGASRRIP